MYAASMNSVFVRLTGPRQLELRPVVLSSTPGNDRELICETICTAISPGTELAAYVGSAPLRDGPQYPRLQGYCNVGRVLAAGRDCAPYTPGDRILSFTSHRSHFAIDVGDVLARIQPGQSAADAAPAYLFHLGYDAILRSDIRPGARVVVIGHGTLGLAAVAMAGIAGARAFALSEHDAPSQAARSLGAAVYTRAQTSELEVKLTPSLADVVIVTTNSWADWRRALALAGVRGTIACLGFPGRDSPLPDFNPLESRTFYVKQLRIQAVGASPERADSRGFLRFNERDNLAYILDLLESRRLSSSLLVSGSYPGLDIEHAYRDLLSRNNSPVTYLLQWNRE